MPIDERPGGGVALFLFAHQDDEFGVFHLIDECGRRGQRPVCAYLTRGVNGLGARRNEESRRVLARLGVAAGDIRFAGDELGIDDATLPESLAAAGDWIAGWVASFARVDRIFVTAWEGGHHDHDALHALTVEISRRLGLLPAVRQFALYNRFRCPGPLFRVLAPLASNGPVESAQIPLGRRLAHLRLCLQYPSQATTWIGLFPFVLLHYVLSGRQSVQGASPARLDERPHGGTLYYEHRRFYRWEQMRDNLRAWRARA
jgi:LmbE family N-acetylglucosaminyl deacetylase